MLFFLPVNGVCRCRLISSLVEKSDENRLIFPFWLLFHLCYDFSGSAVMFNENLLYLDAIQPWTCSLCGLGYTLHRQLFLVLNSVGLWCGPLGETAHVVSSEFLSSVFWGKLPSLWVVFFRYVKVNCGSSNRLDHLHMKFLFGLVKVS